MNFLQESLLLAAELNSSAFHCVFPSSSSMADHCGRHEPERLRKGALGSSHNAQSSQDDPTQEGSLHDEFDPFATDGDTVEETVNISLNAPPQTQ